MFAKLKLRHDLKIEGIGNFVRRFNLPDNNTFDYFESPDQIEKEILNLLPELSTTDFKPLISILQPPRCRPHVDDGSITTINFYIDTGDAVTEFYRKKSDIESLNTYTTKDKMYEGYYIDENSLELENTFKAESGEIWILDVRRPHSVRFYGNGARTAYAMYSNSIQFEDAVGLLKDKIEILHVPS